MKPTFVILVLATAGLAFWLARRRTQQARAEADLWAEATDDVS